jgi:hypothetical protein
MNFEHFFVKIFGFVKRYSHTVRPYLHTPRCRVLLEKLTGLQLVKKFPAFYWTRRFITAFTSARHLSLPSANPIQSTPPHLTSLRSILILSYHLRLGLPSGLFPSGFPTKTLYTPLSSPIRPVRPTCLYPDVQWEHSWVVSPTSSLKENSSSLLLCQVRSSYVLYSECLGFKYRPSDQLYWLKVLGFSLVLSNAGVLAQIKLWPLPSTSSLFHYSLIFSALHNI